MSKSDVVLLAAVALSFVFSVSLWFVGLREEGAFVGLWVPSILALGVYFRVRLIEGKIRA